MDKKYAMLRVNKLNPSDYGLCHLQCADAVPAVWDGDLDDEVGLENHRCHYDKLTHNLEKLTVEVDNMNRTWGHEETYSVVELVPVYIGQTL